MQYELELYFANKHVPQILHALEILPPDQVSLDTAQNFTVVCNTSQSCICGGVGARSTKL